MRHIGYYQNKDGMRLRLQASVSRKFIFRGKAKHHASRCTDAHEMKPAIYRASINAICACFIVRSCAEVYIYVICVLPDDVACLI